MPNTNQANNASSGPASPFLAGTSPPAPATIASLPVSPAAAPPASSALPASLTPWPHPVSIPCLADEMEALIKKHCVLKEEEVVAIVLWIISSYMMDNFRIFPKLTLVSPVRRCGKTTTLEVIVALCLNGILTSSLSPATIYRLSSTTRLTLLIDEADRFVKQGDPNLIGLINSGHTKSGASVIRCEGDAYKPVAFSTWMPMVLASIQDLEDTIMDRSIVINLRRKSPSDFSIRLPEDCFDQCLPLRQRLLRWTTDNMIVTKANPLVPPSIGNSRAQDNWVPLFTIARQIDERWLAKCELAYRALTSMDELELPTELLRDIREIFQKDNGVRMSSKELVGALNSDSEYQWHQLRNGKGIDATTVAKNLKPFSIKPLTSRHGTSTLRGYEKAQFDDAFLRYLPPLP